MCVHACVLTAEKHSVRHGGVRHGCKGPNRRGRRVSCVLKNKTTRTYFYLNAMILVECHDALPRSQLKRCQALMSFLADARSYGGDRTEGRAPAESESQYGVIGHTPKLSAERTGGGVEKFVHHLIPMPGFLFACCARTSSKGNQLVHARMVLTVVRSGLSRDDGTFVSRRQAKQEAKGEAQLCLEQQHFELIALLHDRPWTRRRYEGSMRA